MRKILYIIPLILAVSACEDSARVQQAQKGAAAAEKAMRNTQTNSEIDSISNRLALTSNPNLLGHVAIVNTTGNIVLYTTVKGKITSGSKRLTDPLLWRSNNNLPQ